MSEGQIVATGLAFPEGPVASGDEVLFTEITGGRISALGADGSVRVHAETGGGPNGATLGPDGALWITQNGGMGKGPRAAAGIQRATPDGSVELAISTVAGIAPRRPERPVLRPDGRLWFTDPRGDSDPGKNDANGRLFAVDIASGDGELVAELAPVFPNGIAFDGGGVLHWTESFTRRVMRLVDGRPELVAQLPERFFPDGMCFGADGTMYVASTYGHCVSAVDSSGEIVDRLMCGDGMPTNCCFVGTSMIVTESRHGTLWRFELGVEGLPLH